MEIISTILWNILPSAAHAFRVGIEDNLNNHRAYVASAEKHHGFFAYASEGFSNKTFVTSRPQSALRWGDIRPEDDFINVVQVRGAITRSGEACSCGSIEHRDQVLFASKQPNCLGHLFVIDSPGGSAFSKNDYAQATKAARDAGQPCIAWVDGTCTSAAQALAVLCDEVYYMSDAGIFGCIGAMAMFYTQKNGEKNQYTNATYRELYDPESYDKNADFRALANNEDDSLIIEELKADGAEFRNLVMERRPNVRDEHLHGKTFKAKDIQGILADGQGDYDFCIQRIITLHEEKTTPEGSASGEAPIQTNSSTIKTTQIMNKKFTNIETAINNEFVVTENAENPALSGSFVCLPDVEKIEAALNDGAKAQASVASLVGQVNSLNATIAQLREQIVSLTEEKDNANTALESLTKEKEDIQAEMATLATDKTNLETQLQEANDNAAKQAEEHQQKLDELNGEIENLNGKIADLENAGTQPNTPEASPAGTPQQQNSKVTETVFKPGMTAAEYREAQNKLL